MATTWTINGVTFASLNLKNLRIEFTNQDVDKASFTASGRGIDQPLLWQTGTDIVIAKNGTPYFQGKIKAPHWDGQPSSEDQRYEVLSWMDLAGRSTFCMPRTTYIITLGNPVTITPVTTLTPIVFFGVDTNGNSITLAQEITNILNYFKGTQTTAPIQLGTIEPAQYLPNDTDRSLTCRQALIRRLRWAPLMSLFTDYSTVPPTVSCRQMASLAEDSIGTLEIGKDADGNVTAITAAITKRDDLKVKGVIIYYLVTSTQNGVGYLQPLADLAGDTGPVDANGFPTNPGAPDTLVQTIDLQGTETSTQSGTISTRAIPSLNDSVATWKTFFQQHCPDLLDTNLSSVAIVAGSVTRNNGELVYPNELIAGQIAPWMASTIDGSPNIPINAAATTITARIVRSYKNKVTGASWADDAAGKLYTVQLIATNAPANLAPLTITSAPVVIPGEVIPEGVAAWLYGILSTTVYQGTVTHTANIADGFECPGTARPGILLQLTNGAPEWATMTGALIQRVIEDIDTGKTTITIGAPPHLSARDFVALIEAARNRQYLPNYVLGGYAPGGGVLPLGNNTPLLAPSSSVESGKTGENYSDGTTVIQVSIGDLPDGLTAKFQQCQVCVGGVLKTAYVLMTTPA